MDTNFNSIGASAQPQQSPQSNMIWAQGSEGAKALNVPPNWVVPIFDSEDTVFYIKQVDPTGIPHPLRAFRYEEIKLQDTIAAPADYVTEDRLNDILDEKFESFLNQLSQTNYRKKGGNNGKRPVQQPDGQ